MKKQIRNMAAAFGLSAAALGAGGCASALEPYTVKPASLVRAEPLNPQLKNNIAIGQVTDFNPLGAGTRFALALAGGASTVAEKSDVNVALSLSLKSTGFLGPNSGKQGAYTVDAHLAAAGHDDIALFRTFDHAGKNGHATVEYTFKETATGKQLFKKSYSAEGHSDGTIAVENTVKFAQADAIRKTVESFLNDIMAMPKE